MQLWKGEVSEEFIQTDTNFFNNHLNATNLLECLCASQGQVLPIPTHWLELCSFIHSFIPQISSEHLQHIRHLSRYWRYNSEQSKCDSLPSRIFQVGVHDLWDVWCHIQSCLSLLESGRSALFYPTQSTIYPCSQHILIEHLLHARALLLLLLSRFSHVRLCATPEMTAHQALPSLGFSRQEHWSGLPFPSPMPEP